MPEGPSSRLVIQLEHVSLKYGKVAALDDISFSIAIGESVAIVGPSGSGKTSLLKVISGAVTPVGRVKIDGAFGIVYQDVKLLPWKSVSENIFLGLDRKDALAETRSWIELAGLSEKTEAFPYELSGGQRQRVAVIRALVRNPDILLLDEPFSALDFLARNNIRTLIKEISRRNKLTTLTITHDLEEAVKISERILVVSGGRLIADVNLANRADRDIGVVVSEIERHFVET